MAGYQVKLPVFEGPFDLLFHLIEDQKLNIYDIPIAAITAQYLDYIYMMESLDMEVASGFLIMAATLLEIKSKMLLPKDKKEEFDEHEDGFDDEFFEQDARSELVEKLLEYRRFKLIAQQLREMEINSSRIYTRNVDYERNPEEILEIDVGANDLLNFYQGLVIRRTNPPIHRVVMEKIGIVDRIKEIRNLLSRFRGEMTFSDLLKGKKTKFDVVLSFMAVLEMTKAGELSVSQSANFQPIKLKRSKPGSTQVVEVEAEESLDDESIDESANIVGEAEDDTGH